MCKNRAVIDKYNDQYKIVQINTNLKKMSKVLKCVKSTCGWLTVEPMILLYWGAWNMTCTIKQDFFLSIVCRNLYSPDINICYTEYNDTIKHNIESKVLIYFIYFM